ncbi:hypothetical protein QP794_23645 [Paenibacillus sp. UMB7766-LJ446]|nr:hypothetical protein [Paenibacillus sp. UMB7766-LJ446]
MKKSAIGMFMLTLILALTACSTPIAGTGGISDMKLSIERELQNESRIEASLDESVISDGSWVMFEIKAPSNKNDIWLQAKYEGNGVYSAETDQLPDKEYKLFGHYYAGGGFHFSRQYAPN